MLGLGILWGTSCILSFVCGLEIGRWYRRLLVVLGTLRSELRRTNDVQRTNKERKPDPTPGVVVTPKYTPPIDLEEETGGVTPLSPQRIAAEEDAARKSGR